eukprot:SAG31_NODE_2612_length_5380_cov_3.060405_2_plen_175_part_00
MTKALASGLGNANQSLATTKRSHASEGDTGSSLLEGLKFAAEDFGLDLYNTVTAIFVAPVHGAQQGGASGFVKGVGQGLAQTVISAASTGVDLAAHLTAALSHLLSIPLREDNPERQRLHRVIRHGEILEPYVDQRAAGQAVLHRLQRLHMTERYEDHYHLEDGTWIVLTNQQV